MIASQLGPYRILDKLGEGGMGQVFRARDTKLNRDVALKVLPDSFASDRDRLARFDREAQVLASLNHPNIAHLYGVEDAGETRALIMELVDGVTLAEVIDGAVDRPRGWGPAANQEKEVCRSPTPSASRARLPKRSTPRTSRASSTATSNRPM